MKILLVNAVIESKSFGGALADLAAKTLKDGGYEIQISDLYKMNFNSLAGKKDFKDVSNKDYFQYMLEQQYAAKNNLYSVDIQEEQEKVRWADLIIFQTPIWWFSVPAILKGWFDRVLSTGFAWDFGKIYDKGLLRGKKAMLSVTTGGSQDLYQINGAHRATLEQVLHPINHGILYFCGMEVLPTFVSWSTFSVGDEGRKKYLKDYKKVLENIENIKPMEKLMFK